MPNPSWLIVAAALALPPSGGAADTGPPKAAGRAGGSVPPRAAAGTCSGPAPSAEGARTGLPAGGIPGARPAPHLCGLKPPGPTANILRGVSKHVAPPHP